jgi:ketosteroid isomerase-like protein
MTDLENIDFVRRSYERWNEAYRTGEFEPLIEELFDPEIVLRPAGILPDSTEPVHGREGVLRFTTDQAEAFEELSVEPEEFIEVGDRVVVPLRLGGRARHTGLEIEFRFVHVCTLRDRTLVRLDMYATKAEALEAVGIAE